MEVLIAIIAIASIIAYVAYWINIGTFLNKNNRPPQNYQIDSLTLICVFRDEATHLNEFLNHVHPLIHQHDLSVILVDDHSQDDSVKIIKAHPISQSNKLSLIHLPLTSNGKKAGIEMAVEAATTPIVYITDADCVPNYKAIHNLYSTALHGNYSLILGWVNFKQRDTTFIQSYQVAENSALVALSVFQAHKEEISMGNAANMLFHKADFVSTEPYKNNQHVAGGDDIFLIEAFNRSNKPIYYSNHQSSAISTYTLKTVGQLWEQRIRWAAKTKFQSTNKTRNSQLLLLCFFILIGGCLAYLTSLGSYALVLSIWTVKTIGEIYFLRKISQKLQSDIPTISHLLFMGIFQILFIPLVAIAQVFQPVTWKKRSYA